MEFEFEYKGLITKEAFLKIIEKCDVEKVIDQKNTYFETTDGYFKLNNSALRVRSKNR